MPYAILVLSAVLVEIALNVPTGSLPLALAADGVPPAGIATVATFAALAPVLGSVPLGGLVDRFGRVSVMVLAAVASCAALAALAFVHGVVAAALVMAVRSLAITAYVTATFAYAAGVVRAERAVSATATLGMVGNFSFALSPALAVALWQHGIGREQYLWATIPALLGTAALALLPRGHDVRIRRSRRIFYRKAWLPAIAFLVGATLVGGVNAALAVITFHQRGIANAALLFTALACSTFALRYPAGRLVDRFGAVTVALPTALVYFAGTVLASRAHSPAEVIAAGATMGVGWAAMVPVGIGLLFARSTRTTRGAAMGAYNFAFAVGNVGGSALAAACAAAGPGYAVAVVIAGAGSLVAYPLVWWAQRPHERATAWGRSAA